ncbi:MAG: DNA (cytosine-5-)-methyltransferase, partial [Flammeovirgaceae bacterium]|nr:DNA (cytosine-5-)-methyltransferase [Flammeovirgaceae bacterium]
MKPNQKLTAIDLFAGCGGLSLGLEQSGFTPIMMVELNSNARQSYLMNRQGQDILATDDIKDVVQNIDDIKYQLEEKYATSPEWTPDLIAGGPPCQGFSGMGHRRSYSVDKEQLPSNHLYQDMAFVISKLQPKMFLFENVRGLLTSKWNPSGTKGE